MTMRIETEWRQLYLLPSIWVFHDPLTSTNALQIAWLVWSLNFCNNEDYL